MQIYNQMNEQFKQMTNFAGKNMPGLSGIPGIPGMNGMPVIPGLGHLMGKDTAT